MMFRVKLPDYPSEHIVTGLTTGKGASGRKLLLAEATWTREGCGEPRQCRDLVTLMLLHDAVASRMVGDYRTNDLKLYGRTRELQNRSASRIAGATVESLIPAGWESVGTDHA